MEQAEIGIIGGSGLYDMEGLKDAREVLVDTPFGRPSDAYIVGTLEGRRVAFLARHGRGHRFMPSDINYRANIYGFKLLGVSRILSASAVGSLKEDIHPLDIVLPDQFIDRTRLRPSTFFGAGLVAHVSFSDPICPELLAVMAKATAALGRRVHQRGTYVCMEGPQFSTRAESRLYREAHHGSVIGMTNLQEAKLAREAEICYVTMALVTDYDCWHEDEAEAVSVEVVIKRLQENAAAAKAAVRTAMELVAKDRACPCAEALKNAIITSPGAIDPEMKKRLHAIVGRHLGAA